MTCIHPPPCVCVLCGTVINTCWDFCASIRSIGRWITPGDKLHTAHNSRQLAKRALIHEQLTRETGSLSKQNLTRECTDCKTESKKSCEKKFHRFIVGEAGSHPRWWHLPNTGWHIPGPKQQNSLVALHAKVWHMGSCKILFTKSCWELVSACCIIQTEDISPFAYCSEDLPLSCGSLHFGKFRLYSNYLHTYSMCIALTPIYIVI